MRFSFQRVTIASLVWFAVTVASAQADETNQASTTFANIKPSLAFVVSNPKKKSIAFGTAFCIASYSGTSIFLTNRHVVGDDESPLLVLMSDPNKVYHGVVLRKGTYLDIAVIAVPANNVPVATLATTLPSEGQNIAIAGFPAMQIDLFFHKLGLSPSLHLGVISALIAKGALLEYDAQTDHGNSGGPLFDVQSGFVYGVVTWGNTGVSGAVQNNVAIAVQDLSQFLANAHVQPTLASTASPAASPVASVAPQADLTACHQAMSEFWSAYNDYRAAFNRYVAAAQNTTKAAPTTVPTGPYAYMSYIGVEVYVNLEVKAINSVINAEEPKLQSVQSDVANSHNEPLERVIAQLVNDIQTQDQYSSMWTQSRYRLVYTVAGGGYPTPVDQSAMERVRDVQADISTIVTQLNIGDPCKGG